jgi:hypothetical protein
MRCLARTYTLIIGFFISSMGLLSGQETTGPEKWDTQFFLGNKVAGVNGNWKYSGELQVRLKDNTHSLDRWFLEGVATYMPSKHWEIVPDYRLSIKPNSVEHRPGFGVLRKDLFGAEESKCKYLGRGWPARRAGFCPRWA